MFCVPKHHLGKSNVIFAIVRRNYQSNNGVYGSRPKLIAEYEAKLQSQGNGACIHVHSKRNVTSVSFFSVKVNYEARAALPNVYRLVSAFRCEGHKFAKVNPVPYKAELARSVTIIFSPTMLLPSFNLFSLFKVTTSLDWVRLSMASILRRSSIRPGSSTDLGTIPHRSGISFQAWRRFTADPSLSNSITSRCVEIHWPCHPCEVIVTDCSWGNVGLNGGSICYKQTF